MNWKELKEFCNKLPDSELTKEVIIWRENECISKIEAETLEEDYYYDKEENFDGCIPESEAKYITETDPLLYPSGMDDLTKLYEKGHPILSECF